MGKNIVDRAYLVKQFQGYDEYALKETYQKKIIDEAAKYVASTSTTSGALLIIADGTTPSTGEINLATVELLNPGEFAVGDYVLYQAEKYHYVTAYKDKFVKEDEFADHFENYTKTEIESLFDGTKEEIVYYKSLIDDDKTSKYFLWSSSNINDKILAAVVQADTYADSLVADLANIQLKYVTTLPSVGAGNVIYILESTTTGVDPTLNLYDSETATWKTIGSFKVDMTNYYTKAETDTLLADYAKTSEVLKTDDVENTNIDFSTDPWS